MKSKEGAEMVIDGLRLKGNRERNPAYYSNWPFWVKPPEPSAEEINRYRLWKDKGEWYSLIGARAEYWEEGMR